MAKKARPIEYDYVDDIDGRQLPDGTDPTKFTIGGARYEIDLGASNRKRLEKALNDVQVFIDAARTLGAAPGRKPASAAKSPKRSDLAEIRAWRQSLKDSDLPEAANRGRIPNSVVEAFDAR